jgi:predicted transcriptional regulator
MKILKDIIKQLEQEKAHSVSSYITGYIGCRTVDYRIGLTKAIDIIINKMVDESIPANVGQSEKLVCDCKKWNGINLNGNCGECDKPFNNN